MSVDGAFLISINGQVEWIDLNAEAGLSYHCKYEIVAGPDWKIVAGLEAALSQNANTVENGAKIVVNLPVEVVYKSTNPFGWPQIVLSVYSGTKLEGYGRIHVPLEPGCHELTVPLGKPQSQGVFGYLAGLFGYGQELIQPTVLAGGVGNYLLKMTSHGEVRLSLNILAQGLRGLGYDCGRSNQ